MRCKRERKRKKTRMGMGMVFSFLAYTTVPAFVCTSAQQIRVFPSSCVCI